MTRRRCPVRLQLYVVTGALLLACSLAAWILPPPTVGAAAPGPVATASVDDDPCSLIVGPAHAYCQSAPPAQPAAARQTRLAGAVANRPEVGGQAGWLLLFSSVTVAAAIGLAVLAGRSRR